MSDARWLDVDSGVETAVRHFRMAAQIYERDAFDAPGIDGYSAGMALMHAMQSGHTSAEAALVRVLAILDETLPTGSDWHDTLIRRLSKRVTGDLARPALLSESPAADLDETRRFRHRAIHGYEGLAASLPVRR